MNHHTRLQFMLRKSSCFEMQLCRSHSISRASQRLRFFTGRRIAILVMNVNGHDWAPWDFDLTSITPHYSSADKTSDRVTAVLCVPCRAAVTQFIKQNDATLGSCHFHTLHALRLLRRVSRYDRNLDQANLITSYGNNEHISFCLLV